MARRRRTSNSIRDPSRLLTAGLDPADPKAALDALAPKWGSAPDLEAFVVARLADLDDPESGTKLQELEGRTTDKAVRREIRRALYRLEQRGLWTRPEAPAPPPTRELLGAQADAAQGWLTRIDPTGTRLVWMARSASGGLATLSVVISEEAGIREFHSGQTTRKALREAQREIAATSGITLVEAPWPWAWHLVREAYDRTERGRFPEVPGALHSIVPNPPAEPPAPPIDALLDRARVAEDETALAASAELLAEPEVGAWLLPLAWLEPILERLADAESSVVLVSPAAREERFRVTVEEAARTVLDPADRRERFARRLEESAFLLAARGAQTKARSALAAAIAARVGRSILEIPVLAELTRRSLAVAHETRAAKRAEERKSSLVLTPQQALAESRKRRHR